MTQLSTWIQRTLIAIGCVCLGTAGISLVRAAAFQETAAKIFENELMAPAPDELSADVPIGRLEIPRLHLSVIVMQGDDDETLARAAGHVTGTALPWDEGNTAIAGHRD